MKTIILVGGISKWLYPLSDHQPRGMVRIGNEPALRHTLLNLKMQGVVECCIPLDAANTSVRDYFKEGEFEGIKIRYAYAKKFQGTAGCLHLFRDFLSDAPFLIVNGNSFSRPVLHPLLDEPPADNPFLRIGVYGPVGESHEMRPHLAWNELSLPSGESTENLKPVEWNFANVYYSHPGIFQCIPQNQYFDLREQLVPERRARGYTLQEVPLRGTINELHSFEDYLEANHHIAINTPLKDPRAAHNVRISKSATLEGPILIGPNTTIGAHCVIIGPAVIGAHCSIGRGVVIHRSVINSHVRIRSNSQIQKGIVLKGGGRREALTATFFKDDRRERSSVPNRRSAAVQIVPVFPRLGNPSYDAHTRSGPSRTGGQNNADLLSETVSGY